MDFNDIKSLILIQLAFSFETNVKVLGDLFNRIKNDFQEKFSFKTFK